MKKGSQEEQAYQAALEYLVNLTKFGINLGLGRIQALLQSVGNPEKKLRVIHIGGTNGKGSTSIMVAEILEKAGFRVGIFTSPHLNDYRERMTINGKMIPKQELTRLVDTLRPHLEKLVQDGVEHPTEFEVSTTLAFMYFAQQKVDFAVIEVGLGGAIDSTNVVQPLISVITNVGMDHMDYLGKTVEEIALVKAGILKPNSVAITATERPEVLEVIQERARTLNIPLWVVGEDVRWDFRWSGELEQEFDLIGLHSNYPQIHLRLVGAHQIKNAATAVTVCEVLQSEYGVKITHEAIYSGLEKTRWPGRLEVLSLKPKVLIDGAHNVDGANSLADALQLFKRQRLILCFGMLGDKEREKVAEVLLPLADEVIITKPNSPRAGNWQYLAELVAKRGLPVTTIESPSAAVIEGYNRLNPDDMLCVTGSLYMIAEARVALLDMIEK
ncbi:bifunctional folylpolyglutamate synthase/dihydrofolate synthase [Desulfitobacterium metallireducens]|uniref:tetrahydrofolate synthase n=1 Tax=Desulfitobacterium metallireducens DSM 15288 TaxID=871968 RepID=W0EAY9_9FIRM|nr:folylpolyglutamate synthase/dihydrofolate synthase family protein [Desulfitobacterium metallireducens]AHF07937.1 folylpolyglutamate synthase [Desulfitobacterium metallireducens DSM 15288]